MEGVKIIEATGSNKIREVTIINCRVGVEHKDDTVSRFLQVQNSLLQIVKKLTARIY
jgi:hypothetical protein